MRYATERKKLGSTEIAGLAATSLLIAAIFACGRPARTVSGPIIGEPVPTRVQITKPLDVAAIDTEKQRWPTEVLTEKINDQLEALAMLFSDPHRITADALRPIAIEDVSAINLIPKKLDTCFDDGNLRVERVTQDWSEDDAGELLSGIEQLANGFASMARPFKNVAKVRVKFKVIQIELTNGIASTSVQVMFDGNAGNRKWQQNAFWDCDWKTALGPPLLIRLCGLSDQFEQVVSQGDRPLFSDQTAAAIGDTNHVDGQLRPDTNFWLSRLESAHGIDLVAAHGVSIADVNGDGLDDVYVCQPGGLPNRLFIATPEGIVRERASEFGLDICDATSSGLFVDLDNDGDQDVVLVVADSVVIFENPATGQFCLRSQISVRHNPTSVLAADFDSDRLLDLYVLNHDTTDRSAKKTAVLGMPVPFHDANNGGANLLLRNLGEFRFEDVTSAAGLDSNNRRFSLAGCWQDYDDDGDSDIYVANDFGRNSLYRNDEGHFVDVARAVGVEDLSAGMSVSWGDVNNDGLQDLYVSNMFSSAGNRIAYQRDFHAAEAAETRRRFQRHARGNSLFLQSANHMFQDVSRSWNVTMGRWAWASKLADVNNDGLLDILITNGFVTNEHTEDL